MSAIRTTRPGRHAPEHGVVAVIVALSATALLGATALAVDFGRLVQRRQRLQNAVDFGALAGTSHLPARDSAAAAAAAAEARRFVLRNAPGLDEATVGVSFHCSVADRDANGAPDPGQVPSVCGPASGTWAAGWSGSGGRLHHTCDPVAGETCNAVSVETSETVPLTFAPVFGREQGSTGTVRAAACGSGCGGPSTLDVVVVFDRSYSLTATDLQNAKNGVLALLSGYDAQQHRVGLITIPYGRSWDPCRPDPVQVLPPPSDSVWQAAPLSTDYQRSDGSLRLSSRLVSTVSCLQTSPLDWVPQTDVGDPITAAQTMLDSQGRPESPDVIIVFTDGVANAPTSTDPCDYAARAGESAKQRGTQIFTVGYGVGGSICNRDLSGPYAQAAGTTFLADLATTSTDDQPLGCAPGENSDGDHYFCEPGGADLRPVFRRIATTSARAAALIDLS